MDILQKIVIEKRNELSLKKKALPFKLLENQIEISVKPSLSKSLVDHQPGIIAEFKRRSPSKPTINLDADVSAVVSSYMTNGAAAISVLTNEVFFGGSINDLKAATNAGDLPVLRKEFIVDRYQIAEAQINGGSAILLIAEILTKHEIDELALYARKLGLEVLLELHSDSELNKISDHVNVIGVNNRNLKTFKTSIEYSLAMVDALPTDRPKISESGLSDYRDILKLRESGFNGFLIGEYFMKQSDPGLALNSLIKRLEL